MAAGRVVTFALLGWHACQCLVFAGVGLRLFSDPAQRISPTAVAENANGLLWIAADEGVFCFDGTNFSKIPGQFDRPAGITVLGTEAVIVAANNGVFQYYRGITTQLYGERSNSLIRLSDDLALIFPPSPLERETQFAVVWDGSKARMITQRERSTATWLARDGSLWQLCGTHPCRVMNSEPLRAAVRAGDFKRYFETNAKVIENIQVPADTERVIPGNGGFYLAREFFSGVVTVLAATRAARTFHVGEFTRANGRPGMFDDSRGRVWIPGDYLWVGDNGAISKFSPRQLDGIQVNCVFEDRRGRIWFGLAGRGLAVMGMEPAIENWYTPEAWGAVNSLIRLNATTLVGATLKGGLLVKRGEKDWQPIAARDGDRSVDQVAPMGGAKMMGLIRLGPPAEIAEDGRVLAEIRDGGEYFSSMRRIVAVPDGTFLVGGLAYRQLFRIRGRRLERIKLPGPGGNAQGIELDEKGRGWVGFDDGVCRVEGNDCVPEIFPKDGLLNATVRSLGLGASGVVWVAYRNGIGFSQFRRVNDRWVARHFTAAGGYDHPDTQFLQPDLRGWIWRGTDDGLFVSDGVHLDPGDWMRITEAEGLPSSRINRFGFLEDKDGTIWIGTERGIARIRPDSSWFSGTEPARITGAEQRSRIVFSNESLSLPVGGGSLFPVRYRLTPRDKEWQVSRSGKLNLTNLRAGRYQLETARGPAGEVSRYSIEVRTSAAARLLSVSAVGVPMAGATGIAWIFLLRKRRATSLQPLPDLTAARLEVLLPETQRLTGTVLDDRFVLGRIVARGGFGTVFQANDLREDRSCAIKVFREEFGDAGFAKRFEQEVTALEAVSHPNIVKTLGHGMTPGGSPYLAMEFIDGHTLRDVLPSDGLPPATCATLLRQIGGALHEIHSKSIFHRDVKPENLMIRTSGPSSESLVLIDFSMAIVKDPDKSFHGLSRAGGTFHYMAPEQALGHAGPEADIYSLAKVLMEMLTGQRLSVLLPDATLDLAERVAELLGQRGFGLSRPSMELLASAVEFDPGRRPKNVLMFAQRIASDLDGAVSPTVLPVANASPWSSDGAPGEASVSSPPPIPPE